MKRGLKLIVAAVFTATKSQHPIRLFAERELALTYCHAFSRSINLRSSNSHSPTKQRGKSKATVQKRSLRGPMPYAMCALSSLVLVMGWPPLAQVAFVAIS